MADEENKWSRPDAPPPPIFLGEDERNFVKQVNDEILEKIIGQPVLYFPIDLQRTNYHPLYGEAIDKTFLPPIRVYALIDYDDQETTTTVSGIDRKSTITVFFHKRRLTEDQDLWIREGDQILYGNQYYEIVQLKEPTELLGRIDNKMEIAAICIKSRNSFFNGS